MSATEQERAILSLTVDQDGQLVLPAEVCDAVGLAPGDTVEVEWVLPGILLVPVVTDEEAAAFWGPDWRERLTEAEAEVAAGRTRFHASTEDFLAALDAYADAHPRRG